MMLSVYKIFLRLALIFHNFISYQLIDGLAIRVEGGIHPKHRLMKYHQFFVDNISSGDRVLDVGCSNGALTFDVAKKAKEIKAIDVNEKNIFVAKRRFSAPNIEYIVGDIREYTFNDRFDVVILSNVLEHLEERNKLLTFIKGISSKFLIRVPMVNRDWISLYKREIGVEWRSDKGHYIEYTVPLLRRELHAVGLDIEKYSIQFGEIWAVAKRVSD